MTMVDAWAGTGTMQVEVSCEPREAGAEIFDRVSWVIYVFIFAVLPFAVVLFRTHLIAWHYYVAGAMFLAGALAICAMNLRR